MPIYRFNFIKNIKIFSSLIIFLMITSCSTTRTVKFDITGWVLGVTEQKPGELLIATDKGLYSFSADEIENNQKPKPSRLILDKVIRDLDVDQEKNIILTERVSTYKLQKDGSVKVVDKIPPFYEAKHTTHEYEVAHQEPESLFVTDSNFSTFITKIERDTTSSPYHVSSKDHRSRIFDITVTPDNTLFIATTRGLIRVEDEKKALVRYSTSAGNPNVPTNTVQIVDNEDLYISGASGLFKSSPPYKSFQKINLDLGMSEDMGPHVVADFYLSSKGNLYISTTNGLYLSEDNAKTFRKINLKLE